MDTLRELFHPDIVWLPDQRRKATEVWQYWAEPYAADELFS
jgi:hypothetical protein